MLPALPRQRPRAGWSKPCVLTDSEARTEAAATLDGPRAVPVVTATTGLEHTAISLPSRPHPPTRFVAFEREAHEAFPAAPLDARRVHGHARDRTIGL